MSDERTKLELSVPQIAGGALAAASAAVASSWLGVAGTVLGAVIVSLVASVGSAIYTHSLKRSAEAIRETIPVVPLRTLRVHTVHGHTVYTSEGATANGDIANTATLPPEATAVLPADQVSVEGQVQGPVDAAAAKRHASALPTPPRPIRWGAVAVSAAAMLVLAIGALTGFELVAGKSAASLTGNSHGRTTLSQLVHPGSSSTPKPSSPTTPSNGSSPTPGSSTTDSTPTQTGSTPTTAEPTQTEPTQTTGTQPTQPELTSTQPTGTPVPAQPTGAAE